MRTIRNDIDIQNSASKVFESLTSASAVKIWWSANQVIITKKEKGHFIVQWGENINEPDFVNIFEYVRIDPPKALELKFIDYISKTGDLPFETKFSLAFEITKIEENSCNLKVINSGFPDDKVADDFYQGCIDGWQATLSSIKDYNENQNN